MNKPKITFFMLAYNSEKTIEKAIDSVLGQTERDILLIVRNNGSSDSTGKILREKAALDSRLHIVENKLNWKYEDGTSFTKDGVIRIWPIQDKSLLGEYLSIVDSDDWLEPDFAEKLYSAAKAIDADIAVCGHAFMRDGTTFCGERLPPELSAHDLSEISDGIKENYMTIHNSFRTWWAKLFKTEFFLEHYDEAWQAVGGPYGDVLDTVIMLRYLSHAKSLACLPLALYRNRTYSSSTYGTRPPIYLRVLEAEALYMEGHRFLNTFKAQTQENNNALLSLQWAYVLESLACLNIPHAGITPREELSWITEILSNRILSRVCKGNEEMILNTALKYALLVFERGKKAPSLYSSYLVRLLYVDRELKAKAENHLLYPIVVGCLYDRENVDMLGQKFLKSVLVSSKFKPYFPGVAQFQEQEAGAFSAFNELYPHWVVPLVNTDKLEEKLVDAVENSDLELICDLIEEISAIDPFNRNAMFFRIQMARIAGMAEFSAVLAGTALALWPVDIEMQLLCWETLRDACGKE